MPSSQGPQFVFALREALSDVANMKVLGAQPGLPIELDYAMAAGETGGFGEGSPYGQFSYGGGTLALLDQFITPATIPASILWQAGEWLVVLSLVAAQDIDFTVALFRADLEGNILEQIGATPNLQTANASTAAPTLATFSVNAPLINAASTDRILLQLAAKNTDLSNAHILSVMASQSGVETSMNIPLQLGNQDNSFRRNKFLGFYFRMGDGAPYFDKNGINLDTYRQD